MSNVTLHDGHGRTDCVAFDEDSQFPNSISNVSLYSNYSATSTSSSSSSRYMHNPYSLSEYLIELPAEEGETTDADGDVALDSAEETLYKGTMVLLIGTDGKETIMSKSEMIKRMRRKYGYVDGEVATPCFHFGRCRLRYKNSITHCRCKICGAKWREIAHSRIREDQMEAFQKSAAYAKKCSNNNAKVV